MIPFPNKKYQIIYADPPWNIKYLKETKIGINVYDLPYSTISDREIVNLPIKKIIDKNAVLFLWCIDSKLPILKRVMYAWGFDYVTIGFVWNKIAKTTKGVNAILSKYTRKSCEFCYIGKRGQYIVKNPCSVNQFINQSKSRHSAKPPEVRNKIVELVGDLPRIELFARKPKGQLFEDSSFKGWDLWGDEV